MRRETFSTWQIEYISCAGWFIEKCLFGVFAESGGKGCQNFTPAGLSGLEGLTGSVIAMFRNSVQKDILLLPWIHKFAQVHMGLLPRTSHTANNVVPTPRTRRRYCS